MLPDNDALVQVIKLRPEILQQMLQVCMLMLNSLKILGIVNYYVILFSYLILYMPIY